MLYTILVVVLILALIGALPNFQLHSFGAGPSSALGIVLVVLLILWLMGRLPGL